MDFLFPAFWCFPRPILAIIHIANVFLSGYRIQINSATSSESSHDIWIQNGAEKYCTLCILIPLMHKMWQALGKGPYWNRCSYWAIARFMDYTRSIYNNKSSLGRVRNSYRLCRRHSAIPTSQILTIVTQPLQIQGASNNNADSNLGKAMNNI